MEHAPPGARQARRGARAGRRGGRRAGRGQVAPGLRVHPLAPRARLARAGGAVGLLRQGHRLPAGHRPAARATSRSTTRDDHARDPREGRRASCSTLDRDARAAAARAARAARRAGGRSRRGSALDPPQRRQRTLDARQAPAAAREPGAAAAAGLRGPALDRRRDQALLDSLVESLPPARAPAARQLPARVPAPLGQQDATTRSCGSTRCRAESADELLARAARRGPGARAAQAAADRAHRGQPVLPRGERAHAGGDRRAGGRARAPTG